MIRQMIKKEKIMIWVVAVVAVAWYM